MKRRFEEAAVVAVLLQTGWQNVEPGSFASSARAGFQWKIPPGESAGKSLTLYASEDAVLAVKCDDNLSRQPRAD